MVRASEFSMGSGGGGGDSSYEDDDDDPVPDSRPERAKGQGPSTPDGEFHADDIDDSGSGRSVSIPGTDYSLETSSSEADVVDVGEAATDATDGFADYVGDPLESASGATEGVTDSAEEYVGNPLEEASDVAEGVAEDAEEFADDAPIHISDDWSSTEDALGYESDTIHSYRDMGDAILDGDVEGTLDSAGETFINVATGGGADEFREEVIDTSDGQHDEWAESYEESMDEGGLIGTGSAAGEVIVTGADTMMDSPQGSIQDGIMDTASTATFQDDPDDLADSLATGYENYRSSRAAMSEGLPDWAPGSEGSNTAKVLGTATDWLVDYPLRGGTTFTTGVDLETGETDQRPGAAELADFFLAGPFAGLRAGRGGIQAASNLDAPSGGAASSLADRVRSSDILSGSSSSSPSGGGLISDARATTPGTGPAQIGFGSLTEPMVRGFGQVARRLDDVSVPSFGSSGRTSSGDQPITFEGTPSGSTATDTASVQSNVDNIDPRFGDGPTPLPAADSAPAGATPDSSARASVDDVMGQQRTVGSSGPTSDGSTSLGQTFGSTGGVGSTVSDTVSGVSFPSITGSGGVASDIRQSLGDVAQRVRATPEQTPGPDVTGGQSPISFGGSGRTPDSTPSGSGASTDAARGQNEPSNLFSRTGDGRSPGGQTGTTSRTPDGSSPSTGSADNFRTRAANWFSGNRAPGGWRTQVLGGSIGALALSDVLGIDPSMDMIPGVAGGEDRENGSASEELVDTFFINDNEAAQLKEIKVDDDSIGFAIPLVDNEFHPFDDAGQRVLTPSLQPQYEDPVRGSAGSEDAIRRAMWNSRGPAEQTWEEYKRRVGAPSDGDGDTDPDDLEDAEFTGELDVPDDLMMGERFEAGWGLDLDGINEDYTGRLQLVAPGDGEWIPLGGEASFTLTPEDPQQTGLIEVGGGWASQAGDVEILAVSEIDGELKELASDSTQIQRDEGQERGNDQGDDPADDGWGTAEVVEELPYGWYLYAQPRLDDQEQVRFLVAGRREDGEVIYIYPNGDAGGEAHTYPDVESAAAAFEAWAEKHEGAGHGEGGTPSEGAERPHGEEVAEDAAEVSPDSTRGGLMGVLNGITSYARQNPARFAAGSAVSAAALYWLNANGYFDGIKRTIKTVNPLN